MGIPGFYYVSAVALIGMWSFILVQGFRLGMVRHYRAFYVFTAVSMVCYVGKFLAALVLGLQSLTYLYLFVWGYIVPKVFALGVLWSIAGASGRKKSPGLILLPLLVAGLVFADTPREAYFQTLFRLTNGLFTLVTMLGVGVIFHLRRARGLAVGMNLKAQLGGIVFPNALEMFGHFAYFSGLPVRTFVALGEPVYLLSWVVMCVGMRRLDPPRWVEEGELS